MAKRHLLILGLLLSGSALASACSDEGITTVGGGKAGAAGEAGEAGAAGKAGGKGDPGSAGKSGSTGKNDEAGAGGASDEGGAGGAGGEAGEGDVPYEFPSALDPQAVIVVGPAPATPTHLLVGGTDYATKGEIVSITLGTGLVGDSTTYADSDLLTTSSAGIGFAIERTNDKVHRLNGGTIGTTFDLKSPGTDTAPISNKAYVPFLNQSLIAILDLSNGKVSRRIDLNEFNAPGDGDHSADIAEGVYDPTSGVTYFLLQRIDRDSINVASNFTLRCSTNRGLIVGISAATDTVVDLNGSAAGKAIELKLVNPRSLSVSSDGTKLTLLADGCYDGDNKAQRGVEIVNLADHTTSIAYQAPNNDYLATLIVTGGGNALLESYDADFATHWNELDIATGTLGAELQGVPDAPSFDGTDLLGVRVTAQVGTVVRYNITTGLSTVISATSWSGDYSSASGTALVQ